MDNNTKKNKNINIFKKYLNNNKKLKSWAKPKIYSYVGKKYFPPVSKEWINSVYTFNNNNIKNLPIYDININSLIKNYFDLYLNPKLIFKKRKVHKHKYLSLNKIYVSKAEIKHTNNKAILTVYVYNREKISLLKKIRAIKKTFFKKLNILKIINKSYFKGTKFIFNKKIKELLYNDLVVIRKLFFRYKLKLNFNKYKFEETLLFILNNLIIKIYNKKVEFNIVNMKSIFLNSDIFTKLLTLKIQNPEISPPLLIKTFLNKVVLPKVNRAMERSRIIKSVDFNLIENKFKNLYINSKLKNKNLSKLLNNLYYNVMFNRNYTNIYKIIFDSINYKNLGGIRLEINGRLSKRNRADKSVYIMKWKGGLKNIDSSYKGLSSINMRGYVEPNLDYSIITSKRHVGAFAVKGWIGGK